MESLTDAVCFAIIFSLIAIIVRFICMVLDELLGNNE